jgi:ADP-ribose pyrophosphatase
MKINEIKDRYEDPYILVKEAIYENKKGEEGRWSYVERKKQIQAVVVIPYIRETGEVIIIRQYRVPVDTDVIEFPAGLMDVKGESPEECALRELKEETGYEGKVTSVSPVLVTSAGLTSEEIYLAWAEVDPVPGQQDLEASEEIEVIRVKVGGAKEKLDALAAEGCYIDSKVWSFLGYPGFWMDS